MCFRSCKIWFFFFLFKIVLAVLLLPFTLYAASDPQEDIQQLETVVITDTKTPTPISQVTSAVEVITAEDFKRRNDRTLVDALGFSQGAAIFSNGGPGTTATFRIRGGGADQTLVLIDGAIVNSATLGQFNFGTLTTDNIESVTIIRGAQSMLWGSDASGGVVDIRTKRGKGIPVARIFSEYGSFNSIREGGSVAGSVGPIDFSASLSRWDMTKFSSINFRRGAAERDALRNWQGSSLIGVNTPWDGRFEFAFRWINEDLDIDNPSTFGGPFDVFKAKSTTRQYIYTGTYSQPLTNWWDVKATIGHARETGVSRAGTNQRSIIPPNTSSVPPGFGNSDIRTKSNRMELQSNFYIGEPIIVTVGYQFREQLGESRGNFTEQVISSHAGFAQAQLNLFDRLFATGGFRQDSHNTAGDKTTYRFTGGYVLKETGTKLRGSYATGFRTPDINELFFPNFGNPTLQPEKSKHFDVAIDQKLFENRLTMSVGYFWSKYQQLIVSAFDPTGCMPFTVFGFCAQNVGRAKVKGVETSIHMVVVQDMPYLKRLDFDGQYTYTSTRDLMTNTRLARWPAHQASGSLTIRPIAPLGVTGTFRYVGSRFSTTGNQRPLPKFYIFNLAATYQVNSHIEVYTRVENLADRKYEEILFFGTPGRSIWGGVRVNFEIPIVSHSESNE